MHPHVALQLEYKEGGLFKVKRMKKVIILFVTALACFGAPLEARRRAKEAANKNNVVAPIFVVQPTKASAVSNTDAKVQAVAQALPKPGSSQWRQVMCAAKAWARMDVRDCNPEDIKAGKKIIKKVAAYVGVAVVFVVSVITARYYGLKWRAKRRQDANWRKGYDDAQLCFFTEEKARELEAPLRYLRQLDKVHLQQGFWAALKDHVLQYGYIEVTQPDLTNSKVSPGERKKRVKQVVSAQDAEPHLRNLAEIYGVKY